MIFNLLQNMHGNVKSMLIIDGDLSCKFPCRRGVHQGCNLSTLLFSLYVTDLENVVDDNQAGEIMLINSLLRLLLFADDLVLLADSVPALQKAVDIPLGFAKDGIFKSILTKPK